MTKDEYRRLVLESADADGKIDAPATADWWVGMGLLMGMYMRGHIERRGPEPRMYDRIGPWYITRLGRAALAALPQPTQQETEG